MSEGSRGPDEVDPAPLRTVSSRVSRSGTEIDHLVEQWLGPTVPVAAPPDRPGDRVRHPQQRLLVGAGMAESQFAGADAPQRRLDHPVVEVVHRRAALDYQAFGTGGCDVADECIETQFPAPLHAAGTAVDPRL